MRALIIGAGSVGKRHLANFRQLGIEHLGAVDPRDDRRREIVERFGPARVYVDLDEALRDGYDAVVVCSPTAYHTDAARRSLMAGAHVLMEKPISDRLDGVDGVIALAKERGLVYMVGYTYRFWRPLLAVEDLIARGAIGRPLFADVTFSQFLPDWHPWEDYQDWFMSRREEGGGALLDESHAIDLIRWLFGEVAEVSCRTGNLSTLRMTADDYAHFTLWMDCGMLATIHVDVFGRQPRRTLHVSGDRGNVHVDVTKGELQVYDAQAQSLNVVAIEAERNEMFVDEAKHFLACIRENATPRVSGEDALQTLAVCLAGQESSKTGRAIKVLNGCLG
jgi:predicted dehydrogenase